MKIVIAGGTGFIGRYLTISLNRDHHDVIILTRNSLKYQNIFSNSVKLVNWDTKDSEEWINHLDGVNVIINLVGENIAGNNYFKLFFRRWNHDQKKRLLDSRINAGLALSKAIATIKNRSITFIQSSAVGIYGDRGDEELTEQSELGKDFLANLCKEWERSTLTVETFGIRRIVIRSPGSVLSTKGGSLPFMMLPYKFLLGGPIGNGNQWFSWIHILDEIKAIRYLIDNPNLSGVFNLVAPGIVTNKEFSKVLGKLLHRPSILPLPVVALNLFFGEKGNILLASQRQIPKRLLESGFKFDFPDISNAIYDLIRYNR